MNIPLLIYGRKTGRFFKIPFFLSISPKINTSAPCPFLHVFPTDRKPCHISRVIILLSNHHGINGKATARNFNFPSYALFQTPVTLLQSLDCRQQALKQHFLRHAPLVNVRYLRQSLFHICFHIKILILHSSLTLCSRRFLFHVPCPGQGVHLFRQIGKPVHIHIAPKLQIQVLCL